MDKVNWKPLPKRERKSKKNNNNNNSNNSNNSNDNNDNNGMDVEVTNSEDNAKQVDENIRLRSKRKLAVATLEDTDGVAGEFYECNTIYY
jgi:hypothetical protein